jgi:type I restriction enzyme S subunit
MAQGAAQQNISKQKVAETVVSVPDISVLRMFVERSQPLRDLWEKLASLNLQLTTTRDLLLPRLVSGKLDISDIDLGVLTPTESE